MSPRFDHLRIAVDDPQLSAVSFVATFACAPTGSGLTSDGKAFASLAAGTDVSLDLVEAGRPTTARCRR